MEERANPGVTVPINPRHFSLPASGFPLFNPSMSIGFKEWTLVCDALGRGDQSIIIRKGGIHEGREGFRFQHDEFYLFPTLFHEQVARLKLPGETPLPQGIPGQITIQTMARCEGTELVADLEKVQALAPFHIWKQEIVDERFHYDEVQGVHVAFLRVYQLSRPWSFPDEPKYGGCRSWVNLPEMPPEIHLIPALDDASHAERICQIKAVLA